MKKIISILLLVSTLCLCFVSCGKSDYEKAMELIAEGKYESAYTALKKLENDERAEAELEKIYYIPAYIKFEEENEYGIIKSYFDDNKRPIQIIITGSESGSQIYNLTYDKNGYTTKESCTDFDGDISSSDYSYDAFGNLIQTIETYNNTQAITDYTYDENGKLLSEIYTSASGNKTTIDYTYHQNGELTKIVYSYESGYKYTEDYTYDVSGKLIKEIHSSDNSKSTTDYMYDASGNLIKEVFTHSDGDKSVYDYTYDSNGKLTRQAYTPYNYSSPQTVKEYMYNKNGNLSKMVEYQYDRNNKLTENTSYTYTYDSKGMVTNMTSRTSKPGTVTAEEATVTVTDWTLVYFPSGVPENVRYIIDIISEIATVN